MAEQFSLKTSETFRMKFLLIMACLTLYVASINAQICQGRPGK